jgi:MFS family permease
LIDVAGSTRRAYALFLCALASWFCAQSMQSVTYQWLLTHTLALPPQRVGFAQMAAMLPSLFFLLVGGMAADRGDRRRLLGRFHVGQATIFALLACAIAFGWLGFEMLLGFAIALGTLQAFAIPARDAQISDVVAGNMSRAVAGMNVTQQGAQVLGAIVAGLVNPLGVPAVVALQASVVLAGAFAVARLPHTEARSPKSARSTTSGDRGGPRAMLAELRAGLVEVLRSPVLRPVFAVIALLGVFFVGPFVVLLPLLVRDSYGGSPLRLGVINAMVPLGGILTGLWIVRRGGIGRKGNAVLIGNSAAASCVALLSVRPPFALAALLVFGWGVGASFVMTSARTLFQEHASVSNRARVLSVFSLGIFGAGPIASLLSGALSRAYGAHVALGIEGSLSLAIVGLTAAFSRIRTLR